MSARVLVVEDDETMASVLSAYLTRAGYEAVSASDGTEALTVWSRVKPDVVILDIMLPTISGLEVLRRRRALGDDVAVVMLSARGEEEDRLVGFETGADDYVVKPFSLEELIARVRAVLRRTRGEGDEVRRLVFEDLELDEETREVRRGGRLVELTPTEFGLLRYLLANAGRVLSKAQILDHVWNYDFGGDSNVVETYISYLRKKVDRQGEPLIHTVRGFGYSLRLRRE
jgi:two-component system, OmpR family, response regulator